MRRVDLLPLVLPVSLALGGCDRGIALTNAGVEEVADATRDAAPQQPGRWRTAIVLEAMEDAAMTADPRMAAVLKQEIGRERVTTGCLTPDQARSPAFGRFDAVKGAQCRFDRFAMGGGTLDAAMHCIGPFSRLRVTQAGTYDATHYDLRSTVERRANGHPPSVMRMHVVARRVGSCASPP